MRPLILALGIAATAIFATHEARAKTACGKASWYALTSMTANGEWADPTAMTAAHKSLPFGTMTKVTNLRNGRTVTVRINDRGPFIKGRIIDLTKAAAAELGFVGNGWTEVMITVDGKDAAKKLRAPCGQTAQKPNETPVTPAAKPAGQKSASLETNKRPTLLQRFFRGRAN
ncbi:MAG: septal ring lytic transglycosylase RlpA family protein [Stappiaceae bacterium]